MTGSAAATNAAVETGLLELGRAATLISQGLCLFDARGRLVAANPRYAEIYGLDPGQLRPGQSFNDLVQLRYAQGAAPQMAEADYVAWRAKVGGYDKADDAVVNLANGRTIAIHRRPVDGGGWVSTHEDITHRSRNEAQIAFLARHDALTGLPNRILFRERLNTALAEAEGGRGVAVLCLDLDRFKAINDTLGHPVGDALLRQVAERLQSCTREMDTVARLGGDEFAIIQVGVDDESGATLLASRIIESFRTAFVIDAHTINTNTSIGITLAPHDGTVAGKLLKNGDLALYQAKTDGRGVFRFFTAEMDAALAARRRLEHDLQRAVRDGEFTLHYQPQHDLRTGEITGFEALIRWNDPARGLVLPNEFIAVAEDTGLIMPLGRWTLRRACQDAAGWPGTQRVAVNLSAAQFRDPGLISSVAEALTLSGLAPHRLELEITETIFLHHDHSTLDMLRQFRAMGVGIAMDDFGAGYSSLGYLRRFPFTRVKIDGSFVGDLGSGPEAEAIVRAITQLARSLGMQTTAEGVETDAQYAALRGTLCDDAQGHLFDAAMPADEVLGAILAGCDRTVAPSAPFPTRLRTRSWISQ